jgi:hypothetical protein
MYNEYSVSLSLSWFPLRAACQCLKHFIVFLTFVTVTSKEENNEEQAHGRQRDELA